MIKTIIIDDEILAINLMKVLLAGFEQINVEASFTDAKEALEYLKDNKVDLIFLDIEMPKTDGLEVAQLILNLNIHAQIVFATAHSQYAVEAFEISAMDYLLKPISKERLAKTIERIQSSSYQEINAITSITQEISQISRIVSFGEFNLYKGNRHDDKINFRTSKSKELLAFLQENINHPVHKDKVVEALFGEENIQKANVGLHTSTYYLRKILGSFGCDKALEYKNGYFLFNDGYISSDILEFKKIFENNRDIAKSNSEIHERLLKIYKGKYLDGQDFTWSTDYALWYEERFIKALTELTKFYFENMEYDYAINTAKRLIQEDPYNEKAGMATLFRTKIYRFCALNSFGLR